MIRNYFNEKLLLEQLGLSFAPMSSSVISFGVTARGSATTGLCLTWFFGDMGLALEIEKDGSIAYKTHGGSPSRKDWITHFKSLLSDGSTLLPFKEKGYSSLHHERAGVIRSAWSFVKDFNAY